MEDDNLIMEAVKDGDRESFEALVLKHRKAAIRFAQKFVGEEFMAEDIVQESFAIIYMKRKEYIPKYTFKTYLYTIIRNKCIDYLRKQKNYVSDHMEFAIESAENEVIHRENIKEAMGIFWGLKKEYQRVIYLYEYENMSYKEIAVIMNKTVAQIKITIYRARKKISEILEERYK